MGLYLVVLGCLIFRDAGIHSHELQKPCIHSNKIEIMLYSVLFYGVFNIQISGKQKLLVVCLKEQLVLVMQFFLLLYRLTTQGTIDC
jgi:hypothetical protein